MLTDMPAGDYTPKFATMLAAYMDCQLHNISSCHPGGNPMANTSTFGCILSKSFKSVAKQLSRLMLSSMYFK